MIKAKIKAALLHGTITFTVALVTAAIVYLLWYPHEMASMLKGTGLYLLVLGVEVVLGPVMSLVIYNTRKPKTELIRDYCIIGLIQMLALGYGLHSVAVSRPVYLVFVKDRIEVVAATELKAEDLSAASPLFRSLPWFGPKLICVENPTDPLEKSDLLTSALKGKDIQLFPKYYRECHDGEIYRKLYTKEQLGTLTPIKLSDLPAKLREGEFAWLPVVTRFGAWIVVYQNSNVKKPHYLDLNPFK